MEEQLRAHLKATAAVAALVAGRVDWGVRPQAEALPAIALHLVNRERSYTMEGRSRLSDAVVQIDCWARSYGEAKRLSRIVIETLDELKAAPLQAFVEAERDFNSPDDAPDPAGETIFFRTALDVRVWFTEAAASA